MQSLLCLSSCRRDEYMEAREGSVEQNGSVFGDEARSGAPLEGNGSSTEETYELSRRERERLMRRRLMLDAARAVFAEKGYADATLDEIAQRAEFGKGTLYNYFEGGKEEILFAVFDDLYGGLHDVIAGTFSTESIRERPFRDVFEGFLTALFSFFIERQDQFMIMMKEGHRMAFNEAPEKAAYFMKQGEGVIDALVPPIDEARRRGLIREFPPESVAHMIMGNVKGYHMHMCIAECRDRFPSEDAVRRTMPAPEESARFLSTFLLDGLLSDQDD